MDNSNNATTAVEANKIVNYAMPLAASRMPAFAAATATAATATPSSPAMPHSALSTPTKEFPNAQMLRTIREKLLRTPGGVSELQALSFAEQTIINSSSSGSNVNEQPVKVIKNRYLISAQPSHISAAAAAKTPASYRHLIDLTSSNLQCVDVFTGEQFLCKIINEPLHKVQRAYFQLQQDEQLCRSTIYGHTLIRGVHDLVPLSKNRTYIIIAPVVQQQQQQHRVYENLHTYIRHEKRLCESEARAIFHQICQTVQVCHRNGIILRDLKLKRFYFIDEARTKLQYESLEGSMILDGDDDTLSDKIGCPLYTAPELLCPQPTYQGKPADMWSLGVILYTMLVGQYPFYEKANCNLITVIRHGNVQIPMTLSKSVRWLMLSLLRKNYTERMTASHIFLTPWLKEQRPFHLYLPVNVQIADDWDVDNDEDELECMEQDGDVSEMCALSGDKQEHEYEDIGVEPLDYTHTTLQMAQNSNSNSSATPLTTVNDDDADEDMG
ncbi:tribbles [Drosophila sulfurigaster albostrigata]|uniref:tribbles n=1 Tax=Drosophila sulfurigaster albostrigata TaxID=89887 RepID=UPI002D21C644|nr:tribbles [Drosophila sulfurigaster albostrigata]